MPGRSIRLTATCMSMARRSYFGELPIDTDQPTTRFRRLMIAQDTGGAIVGPARADLYFGAATRPKALPTHSPSPAGL